LWWRLQRQTHADAAAITRSHQLKLLPLMRPVPEKRLIYSETLLGKKNPATANAL
jgi:hypothetical protein